MMRHRLSRIKGTLTKVPEWEVRAIIRARDNDLEEMKIVAFVSDGEGVPGNLHVNLSRFKILRCAGDYFIRMKFTHLYSAR